MFGYKRGYRDGYEAALRETADMLRPSGEALERAIESAHKTVEISRRQLATFRERPPLWFERADRP